MSPTLKRVFLALMLLLSIPVLKAQDSLAYYLQQANTSSIDSEKLAWYEKAQPLAEATKNTKALGTIYFFLAQTYYQKKQPEKAIFYYKQSIAVAEKMADIQLLQKSYQALAAVLSKPGIAVAAINSKVSLSLTADFLGKDSLQQMIGVMELKYNNEKELRALREAQLKIQQRNYLLLAAAILVVAIVLIAYLWQRRNKFKHEANMQAAIIHQQDIASRAIIEAEENERKRIAGDLHDGLGQMISAVRMNLSGLADRITISTESDKLLFDKTIALTDESCKELRVVSHNMMPNALLKSGLSSAVKDFIDKIDHSKLQVQLHTEGLNERLHSSVETVLYRVIQEIVNNVIKHSSANRLDISLFKDAEGISCTIEDNGKGFNQEAKEKSDGIGLKNIQARISYLKGSVEFDSAPGRGTLVAIHIPLSS
jgi:signal transduction histidine kinase